MQNRGWLGQFIFLLVYKIMLIKTNRDKIPSVTLQKILTVAR